MKATPLYDRILFTFVENLTGTGFMPVSKGGIIMTDVYDFKEVHFPKWGKVVKCGPKVSDDIRNSTFILIESGKWTTRLDIQGEIVWQTEESFVMAVTDDESATFRY